MRNTTVLATPLTPWDVERLIVPVSSPPLAIIVGALEQRVFRRDDRGRRFVRKLRGKDLLAFGYASRVARSAERTIEAGITGFFAPAKRAFAGRGQLGGETFSRPNYPTEASAAASRYGIAHVKPRLRTTIGKGRVSYPPKRKGT